MPLLEVIVTSLEDARAAARGGAGRLEVVRALDQEGLTPPVDLVAAIASAVTVPLRVMVRARNAFEATADEVAGMCADARAMAALGVEGIVCGYVRDGVLDAGAIARLAQAAGTCRVTVHRALEATRDPLAALASLAAFPQVDRVLVTGLPGEWPARLARLEQFARLVPAGVRVIAGGGVDAEAVGLIARQASIDEVHVGRAVRVAATAEGAVDASRVASLVAALTT